MYIAVCDDQIEELEKLKGLQRCPVCGNSVSIDAAFCPSCGAKMPKVEEPAAAASCWTLPAPSASPCTCWTC